MQMYTRNKKWIVVDGERELEFNTARDAWGYVFLMREIRPNPKAPKPLYPVTTLNPFPSRKKKKVIYKVCKGEAL